MPYLCMILAVIAFAVLGVTYKLSDRLACHKQHVNFCMFLTASVAILAWGVLTRQLQLSERAVILGLVMGLICYGSVVTFRHAAALGRISTSWTIINLALVLPVLASILVWGEMPSPKHCVGLALTLCAIVLLGIDIGRARE